MKSLCDRIVHKTCRQLNKTSALDRAKRCYFHGLHVPPPRKIPKRSSAGGNRDLCLFCGSETGKEDHYFQKLSLTKDIHDKALALGEESIVASLAKGDLVAIKEKYHRNCYTQFNRRHQKLVQSKEPSTANENVEAIIENELLQFIQEDIAGGCRIFALQNLTTIMRERFKEHDIQKTVNCTCLKEMVLEHFPDLREKKRDPRQSFLCLLRDI